MLIMDVSVRVRRGRVTTVMVHKLPMVHLHGPETMNTHKPRISLPRSVQHFQLYLVQPSTVRTGIDTSLCAANMFAPGCHAQT